MAATYKPVERSGLRSSAPWALRPAQVPTRSEMLAALGRQLRSNYKPIVQDPIPDGLRELAERLAPTDGYGDDSFELETCSAVREQTRKQRGDVQES